MVEKIVVEKGYTIEATSWENDGDNYRTNTMTVDDKEYAISILKMCEELFTDDDVANIMDDDEIEVAKSTILEYLKSNPGIVKDSFNATAKIDAVMDINHSLLGQSEYYYSRVFESGSIVYSPEDVVLDVIAEVRV